MLCDAIRVRVKYYTTIQCERIVVGIDNVVSQFTMVIDDVENKPMMLQTLIQLREKGSEETERK